MNGSCACNYARRTRVGEIALSRISSAECVMKRDVAGTDSFRSVCHDENGSFQRMAAGKQPGKYLIAAVEMETLLTITLTDDANANY